MVIAALDIFSNDSRDTCKIRVSEEDITRFQLCLSKGWFAKTESLSIVYTAPPDPRQWQHLGHLFKTQGQQMGGLRNINFQPPYHELAEACLKSLPLSQIQTLGVSQPTSPANLKAPFFPTSSAIEFLPSIILGQHLSALYLGIEPDPSSPDLGRSETAAEREGF